MYIVNNILADQVRPWAVIKQTLEDDLWKSTWGEKSDDNVIDLAKSNEINIAVCKPIDAMCLFRPSLNEYNTRCHKLNE